MPARKPRNKRSATQSASERKPAKAQLEVLSSKTGFRGAVFDITRDRVREPNGVTAIREIVRHSGSVVVLAVEDTAEGPCVLLERQYRYAAKQYMLELPAGRIDPGEAALSAAKRELLEETGYRARSWKKALFFYPSPGFLAETMTVFLAQGLTAGKARPEVDERIEHHFVPLSTLTQRISAGRIQDGKTIASVLWLACSKNSVF
jgi:ADP-ribose pyrophosphatase